MWHCLDIVVILFVQYLNLVYVISRCVKIGNWYNRKDEKILSKLSYNDEDMTRSCRNISTKMHKKHIILMKAYLHNCYKTLFVSITDLIICNITRPINITNCYSPIFLGNGFFQIKGCIYYKWWRLYYFASSRVCRLTTSLDTNVNDNSYDAHCNWIYVYDKRYVPFAWSHSWG